MVVQDVQSYTQLPKSHYFLTISRGAGMRTFAIRWYLAHGILAGLGVLAVAGLGSTAYFIFHDQLVAALMTRQSQMQYAYEDKLDAMRAQLQRESNRQLADQSSVDRSVETLLAREAALESRAEIVVGLATQTIDHHGLEAAAGGPAAGKRLNGLSNPLVGLQPAPTGLPDGVMSFAPEPSPAAQPRLPQKPHPEAALGGSSVQSASRHDRAAALDDRSIPVKTRLSLLSASLDQIEQVQVGAVFRLGVAARGETERLRGALEEAGLSPERFKVARGAATGGPFVPLPEQAATSFDGAMANLQTAMAGVGQLRGIVGRVPLSAPLPGSPEVTSPFGARVDPFLGRPALHTGVDLREDYGVEVRTTAAGRVSFAGQMGGYGNMVEVDHGSGLVSRYAHLSQLSVIEGDTLSRGAVVGEVGATGRATGPHLHYEVRIDGEPVDPLRFLNAGQRLAKAETHF